MKAPIIIALFLALVSCDKKPNVTITGNKSTAAPGEEIQFTINASGEKKMKTFVVDALLYTGTGIENTGRIYINENKTKQIADNFSYTIPLQYMNENFEAGDFYEFTIYTETGNTLTTTSWKVELIP